MPPKPTWSPRSAMTLLLCLMGGTFRLLHFGMSMLGGAPSHDQTGAWKAGEKTCAVRLPYVQLCCLSALLEKVLCCNARVVTALNALDAGVAVTLALTLTDSQSKEWTDDINKIIKQLSQAMAQQQWVQRIADASQVEKRAVITQVLCNLRWIHSLLDIGGLVLQGSLNAPSW